MDAIPLWNEERVSCSETLPAHAVVAVGNQLKQDWKDNLVDVDCKAREKKSDLTARLVFARLGNPGIQKEAGRSGNLYVREKAGRWGSSSVP